MVNSRDIARKYKKRNSDVNYTIKRLVKRNPELSKHFIESSYISDRGKCYIQFEMDEIGVDILNNKYKYNVRSARFEYKYLNEIKDFLSGIGIDYVPQFQVGVYKIDLYIPKYNIAIEIDEEEHKYKKDYDLKRQNYIENKIYCKFIRVNEGDSCGSVLARIIKELNLILFKCA